MFSENISNALPHLIVIRSHLANLSETANPRAMTGAVAVAGSGAARTPGRDAPLGRSAMGAWPAAMLGVGQQVEHRVGSNEKSASARGRSCLDFARDLISSDLFK